jgi:DNA-binding HxlR family transcriptional regulator
MPPRRYRQHCALAKSLDVLGDRWTLLVVRELLDGPQRYVDLLDGLVSIPTDTLAARLRHLEQHGIVERRHLPPPADRAVYALTDDGHSLEPLVAAYVRWGRRLVEKRDPDDAVRPRWLATAVRGLVQAERAGVDLTLALRTPDGDTVIRITDAEVRTVDPTVAADVTLTGAVGDLAAALDPDRVAALVADGRVVVEGGRAQLRQLAALFSDGAPSR